MRHVDASAEILMLRWITSNNDKNHELLRYTAEADILQCNFFSRKRISNFEVLTNFEALTVSIRRKYHLTQSHQTSFPAFQLAWTSSHSSQLSLLQIGFWHRSFLKCYNFKITRNVGLWTESLPHRSWVLLFHHHWLASPVFDRQFYMARQLTPVEF